MHETVREYARQKSKTRQNKSIRTRACCIVSSSMHSQQYRPSFATTPSNKQCAHTMTTDLIAACLLSPESVVSLVTKRIQMNPSYQTGQFQVENAQCRLFWYLHNVVSLQIPCTYSINAALTHSDERSTGNAGAVRTGAWQHTEAVGWWYSGMLP